MSKKYNLTKLLLESILSFSLLIYSFVAIAQVDRFPANVSPVVNAPYSLFLEDYTNPAKNQLVGNIVFNDFNEASWTFKLKVTIESSDVRLTTKPGFTPLDPIVVQPGILTQFTSTDWIEYFSFENLDISGSGANLVRQSGQLPEGLYSFCIEVLDYETGDPLSRETCSTAWIQLNDPPRNISPLCGAVIDPKLTSFPIQWQLFNTQSPNAEMGTLYDLTIWQLTDPLANPMVAVPNGQALQVFQATDLSSTTFVYGPAEPLLDLGKTYVYQIRARSPDGRDSYKNGGRSEFCHFSFGWPEGGTIDLKWPEYDGGFKSEEQPYLSWGAPNNKQPDQSVEYLVEVVELQEGQNPDQAIDVNESWFSDKLAPTFNSFGGSTNLPTLSKSKKYGWKVSAFAGEQIVAESEVGLMNGPSLVEFFYAGIHRVNVDYINGTDVTNISGGGEVRLSPDGDNWTDLRFENISLVDRGGFWVMESGEIEINIDQADNIKLTANYEDNQDASFIIEKYRLTKDGLYAYGDFNWDLPFATLSNEKPVVKSVEQWANFNNFKINTVIGLPENANRFNLLDPFDFTIDMKESSLVFINDNNYRFEFDGEVLVSDKTQRRYTERASFTFENQIQIFYMESEEASLTASNEIQILNNTGIWLKANKYEIDFSDEISSSDLEPDWKGIHLTSVDLSYDDSFDNTGQFDLEARYVQTHNGTSGTFKSSIVSGGLNLEIDCLYPEGTAFKFQTFPSNPYKLNLKIEEGFVDEASEIEGRFLIPFVSTEDQFTYRVPATGTGFKKGYLEELDGYQFVHGEEDQRVEVTVKRAALAGNEKINMALALKWDALGMDIDNITGFMAWGDYNVGFGQKGGAISLTERVNTVMKGYDVTIDVIAAGNTEGYYGFASILEIEMGEDVSGVDDVPKTNFYGLMANPYAPEGIDVGGTPVDFDEDQPTLDEIIAEKEAEIEEEKQSFIAGLSDVQFNGWGETPAASEYNLGEVYTSTEFTYDDSDKSIDTQDLSTGQLDRVEMIAFAVSEVLVTEYLDDHLDKIDSVKNWVDREISERAEQFGGRIENTADSILNVIGGVLVDVVAQVNPNDAELIGLIEGLKRDAAAVVAQQVNASFQRAVSEEVTIPITTLIDHDIKGGIRNTVLNSGKTLITAAFLGGQGENFEEALLQELDAGANGIIRAVGNTFKPESVVNMLEGVVTNTFNGINKDSIFNEMKSQVMERGAEYLVSKGLDELGDALSGDLADYVNTAQQLYETGINIKNTVENIANIIKDPKKALKDLAADRMPIRNPNNPLFDLNGYVQFYQYHPNYGDVWVGDVDLTIKIPTQFTLNTHYLQGKKDDVSYYFAEIKVTDESNGTRELGDPLDELAPAQFSNGPRLGSVRLVGIGGRLYKHMNIQEDKTILPDASIRYGWKMGLVLFDEETGGGKMRIAVSGGQIKAENGDNTWNFEGEMQMGSPNPQFDEKDDRASMHGLLSFSYNASKKEFIGYVEGNVKTTGICVSGSFLINTRPGYWRVAIGTFEEPIDVTAPCPGLRFIGYVDISSERFEVGGGIGLGGEIKIPKNKNIDIWIAQGNVVAYAWVEIGGGFAVRWKPHFTPEKLFFWLEASAGIDVNYRTRAIFNPTKKWNSWKSKKLLEILIRGDALLNFYPKPVYIEGSFKMKFRIVGIGFSFTARGKANI